MFRKKNYGCWKKMAVPARQATSGKNDSQPGRQGTTPETDNEGGTTEKGGGTRGLRSNRSLRPKTETRGGGGERRSSHRNYVHAKLQGGLGNPGGKTATVSSGELSKSDAENLKKVGGLLERKTAEKRQPLGATSTKLDSLRDRLRKNRRSALGQREGFRSQN